MLVAFSVAPGTAGPDGSVHDAVAKAVRIVRESGLPNRTDAMFTTIEGEWDEVMAVVRAATDAILEISPRASLVLKADIRPGWSGELGGKVERLERALEGPGAEEDR
ncbi:thiamine-binding protein [Agrococcus sp. SGAir0287]|uniref:thiamine-binding protein n=1 Tax=Agrococcus sp. SGAir0287 TaxID=2070347 RepID=UPI0010CD5495|nr:thiamine-binding protein [Agrococcus sp. SGAir0287]QCR18891.1 hypothetical protein C1N71_05045 [Agrococcus sp. SGAir0287]